MTRYEIFYKRHIVRRKGDINTIKVEQEEMELPVGSILHTTDGFASGIGKDVPVTPDLNKYKKYVEDKKLNMYFVVEPPNESSPILVDTDGLRPFSGKTYTDIKKFKSQDRSKRFIIKTLEEFQDTAKYQNIISHDPLFRVKATGLLREVRMFNMVLTSMLNKVIEVPDRDHFLVFNTENIQFTKSDFTRSLKAYSKMTNKYPESYYYQLIMHLFGMLNAASTESIFEKLPNHVLGKINLVLRNEDRFVIYRLDKLKAMIDATPNLLLSMLTQLNQLSTPRLVSDVEVIDENILEVEPKDKDSLNDTEFKVTPSPKEVALASKASLADHDNEVTKDILSDDNLTPAQKKHVTKLANIYKEITLPDGTLLTDLITGEQDISLRKSKLGSVMENLPDKSMAESSIINFNTEYMEKAFKKDMVRQLVSFGKQGMYLSKFEEEDISDSNSSVIRYKAAFKDKEGNSHTINFRLPKVDEDGLCKINGTEKRMEMQRINTPICKVSSDTVSLSSNYNKTRVQRNASFSNSFFKYLQRIIKKSDGQLKAVIGGYKYSDVILPYEYTILGTHYNGLTTKNIKWSFDYDNRFSDVPDMVKSLEDKYGVYCGKVKASYSYIDIQGVLTLVMPDKTTSKTTVLNLLNEELTDVKFPSFNEWVNFNVLNAKLPVIFVLSYRFGLSHILEYLNVKYTLHPVRERVDVKPSDISVRFNDEKLIVKAPTMVMRLILSGLNQFSFKDITFKEMDNKDAYYDLIQSKKLSINYLRGIDDLFELFMDPVTEDVLRQMGEPTNVKDLLIRATVLLSTEDVIEPASAQNFRYRTYERFNAITYNKMSRALAKHRNKTIGSKNKFSISEFEIMGAVTTDPLFKNVDTLNPMGDLKAIHRYSHLGDGGRTEESMVIKDRRMPIDGTGIISEASTDSGSVGINAIMSTNPSMQNVRGMCSLNKDVTKLEPTNMMSPLALLTPFADNDDVKRKLDALVKPF